MQLKNDLFNYCVQSVFFELLQLHLLVFTTKRSAKKIMTKPKRIVNYTSTAVSITHYHFVKDLKQYALKELSTSMTSQQIMDIALELAWKYREEIQGFIPNPDVEAYLALRAKLIAAGTLPDER